MSYNTLSSFGLFRGTGVSQVPSVHPLNLKQNKSMGFIAFAEMYVIYEEKNQRFSLSYTITKIYEKFHHQKLKVFR